eukprot:Nk52_evm35s2568 gene=Nk52_evmTU35s2568
MLCLKCVTLNFCCEGDEDFEDKFELRGRSSSSIITAANPNLSMVETRKKNPNINTRRGDFPPQEDEHFLIDTDNRGAVLMSPQSAASCNGYSSKKHYRQKHGHDHTYRQPGVTGKPQYTLLRGDTSADISSGPVLPSSGIGRNYGNHKQKQRKDRRVVEEDDGNYVPGGGYGGLRLGKIKEIFGYGISKISMANAGGNGNRTRSNGGASASASDDQRFPLDPHMTASPNDFQKHKLIGMGDIGKVYLCTERQTGIVCAVKILNKKEMIKRKKIKRVLAEREILATAKHPFIVTLYHTFHTRTRLYFAMEYCAGGEFFRMLQLMPDKKLCEKDAMFYSAEVLSALEYLHCIGFIYRDLKPENILLHHSGHIRLADFDLSKRANSGTGLPTVISSIYEKAFGALDPRNSNALTTTISLNTAACVLMKTNSFVGTEEYIAPEVLSGTSHSANVDWWTFGILLFEMVCGKTPFKGKDRSTTFSQILHGKIHFPGIPGEDLSSEFCDLTASLLQNEEKNRLGAKHGASDIKSHAFYKGTNWQLLHNQKPPLIPKLSNALDTRHFPTYYDSSESSEGEDSCSGEGVISSDELTCTSEPENDPFVGFPKMSTGKLTGLRAA